MGDGRCVEAFHRAAGQAQEPRAATALPIKHLQGV